MHFCVHLSFCSGTGNGFEAFFTPGNILVVCVCIKKAYHTVAVADHPIEDQQWVCIQLISPTWGLFVSAQSYPPPEASLCQLGHIPTLSLFVSTQSYPPLGASLYQLSHIPHLEPLWVSSVISPHLAPLCQVSHIPLLGAFL